MTPMIPKMASMESLFWVLFGAMFLIVGVGYWVIWPMGTQTHGRRRSLPASVSFGVLWGASEGVLYVALWSVLRDLVSSDWMVVAAGYLVVSVFKALWHPLFWDVRVSPIHNIESWNVTKILVVHTPNLLVSFTFLTLYEAGGVFVLAQIVAVVGSTVFMRFPSPFDEPTMLDGTPIQA